MTLMIRTNQPPTCHDHKAAQNKNQLHGGCDVTGIGAAACARHGFFIPSSVVDFQKGERQMNMDYSLAQALKNMNLNRLRDVLALYDIMCQYSKKLDIRFSQNPYLELPDGLNLTYGIGLFHVHGHQPSCLVRYAPSFIKGAGQVDGEIIETLWSTLNDTSRSARTATLAHRVEILDDHMNDSNWKKLTKIGTYQIQQLKAKLVEHFPSRFNYSEIQEGK